MIEIDNRQFVHQRAHLCGTAHHVGRGVGQLHADRVGEDGGDHRGFVAIEFFGRFAIDVTGGSLYTVHVFAGFDHVEIDLHDSPFTPESFDQQGIIGFEPFADPGSGGEAKDIFGGLLGDGAASAETVSFTVFVIGFFDGFPVEPVMDHEIVILGGNDCTRHYGVDVVQGAPVGLHGEPFVGEIFDQADHLQRGNGDGHDGCDEHRAHRECDKEDHQVDK